MIMGLKLFISYATPDAQYYEIPKLANHLQNLTEVDDVKYWEEHALENIQNYMKEYIHSCDILLLFCSKNALASKPVQKEWKNAYENKKRIIPVFFDEDHVPLPLRDIRGCKFIPLEPDQNLKNLCDLVKKIANKMRDNDEDKNIRSDKDNSNEKAQWILEQQAIRDREQSELKETIKRLESQLNSLMAQRTTRKEEINYQKSITASQPKSKKIEFAQSWDPHVINPKCTILRKKMIESIRNRSNMSQFITQDVLDAMETVPRELFIKNFVSCDEEEADDIINQKMPEIYDYKSSFRITNDCSISSPEIIASQLSLVNISVNKRVLFIGAKGGYIESIAAELVGAGGLVVIYSGDEKILRNSFETCMRSTPYGEIMKFIKTTDVFDIDPLLKYGKFDVVFVCGAIPEIPPRFAYLLENGGRLIAPVGSHNSQNYIILEKKQDRLIKRIIEDFGVVFGPVK